MPDAPDRLTSALADRYAITRELGRGGMAVVYLARDRKLGRDVALKVLRPDLAAALGSERFLREIEIAARLTHPNILPLHDCGDAGGHLYYTMPFVEGETLRGRLIREKQLPIEDALQITREVAGALGYAHTRGIVHRDIKPENILFTAGHAVVSDFGIARAVSEAGAPTLTETGLAVGTPAYMSPEQAAGSPDIDARSDLYGLGCVLYEMLSGETPFTAPTPQALIAKKLHEPIPRVSVVRDFVSPELDAVLARALARTPADRYATAQQFTQALSGAGDGLAAAPRPARRAPEGAPRASRRPRAVAVTAVLAVLALAAAGVRVLRHRADVRWAREVALPEIERLIGENDVWRNLVAPYRLAERAEAVLGNDSALTALFAQISRRIDVRTDPPGAAVYLREYGDPDGEWSLLGVTPIEQVRVPIGIFRWRIEQEGYEPVLAAAATWDVGSPDDPIAGADLVRTLDPLGGVPAGMVRVEATQTPTGPLGAFFIGRHEVTNREYKTFVDAGGYTDPRYWPHPFLKDGRAVSWAEARAELVDRSGQPGPATWLGGDYPRGQDDHPVSGVSWYEAAAYAEYAGMRLPTATHWEVARGGFTSMIQWPQLGGFGVLAPFANFGGAGPVPVGSLRGFTAYGAYDMPGNVREWCWNESPQGRVQRGGSWEDNTYEFGNVRQAPPLDRSARNGFRLAFYPDSAAAPAAAFTVFRPEPLPDVRALPPVPDAVYAVYRDRFAYDDTDLDARVEYRQESPGGWIHELVSFDATYGGERVLAHVFLPATTRPPYQTVVYFPGSGSMMMPSSAGIEQYFEFTMFLSFLVRNGRAVVYPVYKGTFERGSPALSALPRNRSRAYSDFVVHLIEDLRRTIDYLETREDTDSGRLAYYGVSWGADLGPIALAVDERFEAAILVAAGLTGQPRPEASDLTYVTRVRTPTLILNGLYDVFKPPETSSRPLLDLLGTPAEHKRLILYETDHIPPRAEYIRETLAWLDRYLGPVRP